MRKKDAKTVNTNTEIRSSFSAFISTIIPFTK